MPPKRVDSSYSAWEAKYYYVLPARAACRESAAFAAAGPAERETMLEWAAAVATAKFEM